MERDEGKPSSAAYEDLGYYVNYLSKDSVEDNLSIDTVLSIIFEISDSNKTERILNAMEKHLESKNNSSQPYEDWGVLCCFPPYKYASHLVEKSSYPYVYHNGSDWPYQSALYAFAKLIKGKKYEYPLMRWFEYGLSQDWSTPVEYYNPITGRGSNLQAWSGMASFTIYHKNASQYPYEFKRGDK